NKEQARKISSMLLAVDSLVQDLERTEIETSASMLPEATRRSIQTLLFAAFGLNVLLAGALLLFLNQSITKRIACIINNTRLLSERQPLALPQGGGDEIASIDQAFYASAGKLMELERFKDELVSMVGHDIRTPLTTVNAALSLAGVGAFGQ